MANTSSIKSGVVAGKILQVVSTTLTSTYSESISSGVSSNTVTGLSALVTPASTDSKVLVTVHLYMSSEVAFGFGGFVLRRGATAIGIGDASSSRSRVTAFAGAYTNDDDDIALVSASFLDSPASISELTYAVSLHARQSTTSTYYVNRSSGNRDAARDGRPVSTITLMEVAG